MQGRVMFPHRAGVDEFPEIYTKSHIIYIPGKFSIATIVLHKMLHNVFEFLMSTLSITFNSPCNSSRMLLKYKYPLQVSLLTIEPA